MSRLSWWVGLSLVVACSPPAAPSTTERADPVTTIEATVPTTQERSVDFEFPVGLPVNPAEWDAFMVTAAQGSTPQPTLLWGGALRWGQDDVPVAAAGPYYRRVVLANDRMSADGAGTSLWYLPNLSTEPRLMYRSLPGERMRLVAVSESDEPLQAMVLVTRREETTLAIVSINGQRTDVGVLPTAGNLVVDASWGSGLLAIALNDACHRVVIVSSDLSVRELDGALLAVSCYASRRLVELSPDGTRVALVALDDRQLTIYETQSGTEIFRQNIDSVARALDFDGSTALIATDSDLLRLDTTDPGLGTTVIPFDDFVLSVELIQETTNISTHQVTGVAADDFLNVRDEPDPNAPVRATLPPTYTGLRWTGIASAAGDGGVWWQVELTEPVALFNLGEPLHGGPALGWVNSAFVEPIANGLEADCHLDGDESGRTIAVEQPTMAGLSVRQLPGCSRIVMSFASLPTDWRAETAAENPEYGTPTTTILNENATLEIGFDPSMWAASIQLDLLLSLSTPAAIVSTAEGPVLRILGPVADWGLWVDDRNRLVLDYVGAPGSTSFRMIDGIALIDPQTDAAAGETITFRGFGTVFESWINASVQDAETYEPVEATFGQGSQSKVTTSFLVTAGAGMLADFEFTIEGLEPGKYELVLVGQGSWGPIHPFEVTE